jgi:hypothetical protein
VTPREDEEPQLSSSILTNSRDPEPSVSSAIDKFKQTGRQTPPRNQYGP